MEKKIRADGLDETKEKAEYFKFGLMLGLHTVSDVVHWADSEIKRKLKSPYIFIELSLMEHSSPKDVRTKLNEFPGSEDKSRILRKILPKLLGHMYLLLSHHPEYGPTLANNLYQIYIELDQEFGHFSLPQELYPMLALDDQYLLAQQGTYGTEEEVLQDFLAFLKPYAETLNESF